MYVVGFLRTPPICSIINGKYIVSNKGTLKRVLFNTLLEAALSKSIVLRPASCKSEIFTPSKEEFWLPMLLMKKSNFLVHSF